KGWNDRNHTCALFQQIFPSLALTEYPEMQALALLVRQYLQGFAPVTENDIAWWVGLGKKKIREVLDNIHEEITYIEISALKNEFIQLKEDLPSLEAIKTSVEPTISLLPTLDPYLMGYKDRERYLHSSYYERVFDRTGNVTSTILLNGQIIGIWDFTEDPDPLVKLFFFEDVEESSLLEIRREASRIGKFICEKEVQLVECEAMVPLKHRTAGGFLTPLKDCKA
ncbi:MAG: DNA glycosylase AlkZ-like family protein, partial [Candidatus Hodarchaeota archaeon]